MEVRSLHTTCVLLVLLLMSAASNPLQAYTDPGSGLLLWQSLVGGFIGLSFLFRKYIGRLFTRRDAERPIDEQS